MPRQARAGDLVLVPSRCPHAVQNEDGTTVALALNFVDRTNLAAAISQLRERAADDDDDGAARLADALESCRDSDDDDHPGGDADDGDHGAQDHGRHLPWREFKRRRLPRGDHDTPKGEP